MREIGVLLLVFVPLDTIWHIEELTLAKALVLAVCGISGFVLTVAGIRVEGKE